MSEREVNGWFFLCGGITAILVSAAAILLGKALSAPWSDITAQVWLASVVTGLLVGLMVRR